MMVIKIKRKCRQKMRVFKMIFDIINCSLNSKDRYVEQEIGRLLDIIASV